MSNYEILEQKINQLPPNLVIKLDDYLDFLLSKKKSNDNPVILKQTWAGGLNDYKNNYSSIELQKLALEWRTK